MAVELHFDQFRHMPVSVSLEQINLDGHHYQKDEVFDFGETIGSVSVRDIARISEDYQRLSVGECNPQLAALFFEVTHNPRAFDMYFPIINILDGSQLNEFDQLIADIAHNRRFNLQLVGENRADLTTQMPAGVRYLVAGHLAEIFFFRRDILERFFSRVRNFQLYTSSLAYQQDHGIAGGVYNPKRHGIQLVLSRLFEGFYGPTPGVAPFLHEYGHMLDHFDARTGKMGRARGLLPGLSPRDGSTYRPHARQLFLKGKRLELKRYLVRFRGKALPDVPLPIGHPYVFQNNGEFIAGYFEMFFRNPNYFSGQNPDLYNSFSELFGYDPRHAWKEDFPFYVNANREFYLSSNLRPSKPGLSIPDV